MSSLQPDEGCSGRVNSMHNSPESGRKAARSPWGCSKIVEGKAVWQVERLPEARHARLDQLEDHCRTQHSSSAEGHREEILEIFWSVELITECAFNMPSASMWGPLTLR